jgi:hypothetical protein
MLIEKPPKGCAIASVPMLNFSISPFQISKSKDGMFVPFLHSIVGLISFVPFLGPEESF